MPETSLAFHLRNDILTDRSVSIPEMIMVQSTNAASGMVPPATGETAILDAALRLFAERGFDGVSMRQISEAAGVSKANIYHHFESKEALYIQVLKSACEDFGNIVDGLISDRGLLEDRLGKFASSHIADLEKRSRGTRLILRELIEDDRNRQQIFAENVASDHFQHLLSAIQNSQQSGEVREDVDPAVIAMLMLGANIFFFMAKGTLQHLEDFTLSDNPADFGYAISNIITNGISKNKNKIGERHG